VSDIVLVSMPFGPVFSPSLGLSLLKAQLAAQGRDVRIRYFSIAFAERVGQAFYSRIAVDGTPSIRELAGEWIFSGDLFPGTPAEEEDLYLDEVLRRRAVWADKSWARPLSGALIERIRTVRREVPEFLDRCVDGILADAPRLVGFTSVFQQHAASLALARRLKAARPELVVVLGGANVEGVMGAETVRQFPFVDATVSGEGETVFPELVGRALDGASLAGLPGVRCREGIADDFEGGRFDNTPMVRDMDGLPYPDYGDYFREFAESRFQQAWQPGVFFETSRGCWWGERSHCTFCGLNGATMTFRSKSGARALREVVHLAEAHPGSDVQVVDNILDMAYFKDFVPELARRDLGLDLFYETKSNLKKEQVRMLRAARIRRIQPGIESLSDSVLRLMKKGVSALQNVQLLKWCKELGVEPFWNLLWGFPGEDPDEYTRMADVVPLLTHLRPPVGAADVRLDRFSPNFNDPETHGFTAVRPLLPYRLVYRVPEEAVRNLAYFFAFDYREPRDVVGYTRRFARAVRSWQRVHGKSDLFTVDVEGRLLVWDLRPGRTPPLDVLAGLDRDLLLACDAATDGRQLAEGRDAPLVEERLQSLVERRLLLKDGGRYLALPVPLGAYAPSDAVARLVHETARSLGRRTRGGFLIRLPQAVPAGRPRRGPSLPRRSRGPRTLVPSQFGLTPDGTVVVSFPPSKGAA
jgi:ribosomal peptide maturation radical SAM protein 1